MPAAFLTWGARDVDEFFIPLSEFEVVIKEIIKGKNLVSTEVEKMREMNERLLNIFALDKLEKWVEIDSFCKDFNNYFGADPEKVLFVRTFKNCNEIIDFILKEEKQEFVEVIEEEINMTITDLKFVCKNVYKEPFINKTFIDQLNQKIPIWF